MLIGQLEFDLYCKTYYHPYSRLGQSENKDHPPTQEEIQEVNVSDSETQNTTVHFRFGPYCRFIILEISVGCHICDNCHACDKIGTCILVSSAGQFRDLENLYH